MSENVGEFVGLSCLQCLQNMFPQICWMDGLVIGGHFVEGIFSVNYRNMFVQTCTLWFQSIHGAGGNFQFFFAD